MRCTLIRLLNYPTPIILRKRLLRGIDFCHWLCLTQWLRRGLWIVDIICYFLSLEAIQYKYIWFGSFTLYHSILQLGVSLENGLGKDLSPILNSMICVFSWMIHCKLIHLTMHIRNFKGDKISHNNSPSFNMVYQRLWLPNFKF